MLRDENFPLRDRICKSIYNARTMTSRRSDLRGGEDYDILPQLSGKYIHSRLSLQIRRLRAVCYANHPVLARGVAGIFLVQLENDKFLERKGASARALWRSRARVVIYEGPFEAEGTTSLSLDLKLVPKLGLTVWFKSLLLRVLQLPLRRCITAAYASVLTKYTSSDPRFRNKLICYQSSRLIHVFRERESNVVIIILLALHIFAKNSSIDLYSRITSWFPLLVHQRRKRAQNVWTSMLKIADVIAGRNAITSRIVHPSCTTRGLRQICDSHFYPVLMERRQSKTLIYHLRDFLVHWSQG